MKDLRHTDRLLDDVLEGVAAPEFRSALLEHTLRTVRHRRRFRRAQHGVLSAAVVASLLLAAWWALVPKPVKPAAAFNLVQTQPLDLSQRVETGKGVTVVATVPGLTTQVLTTPSSGVVREFNDSDLLGLLAGKPVALVWQAPHQAELVFLNPADAEGFPLP